MPRKRKLTDLDVKMIELAKQYKQRQEKGETITLLTLIQDMLNSFFKAQRELFLMDNTDNSANGFYDRDMHLSMGKIKLKVPRVRFGNTFRPALLPEKWRRVDKEYENTLLAFLANGYSRSQIKNTLSKLNLPYSEDSLSTLVDLIYDHLGFYREQPLEQKYFAIFIDAYHTKLRELEKSSLQKISIFIAVGITLDGHKQILGYWIKEGGEKLSFWNEILQDLVSRGVSEVGIFITDNFSGLNKLIRKYFPLAHHQLCWVHMKRNLRKHLSKTGYYKANKILNRIKQCSNIKESVSLWNEFLEIIKEKKSNELLNQYMNNHETYCAFLMWPEEVRKYIYTTNVVENINSGIELMRLELGGYFPSRKSLEVNLFIQLSNLNDLWMRKPIYSIKSSEYRIRQIMELIYCNALENEIEQNELDQILAKEGKITYTNITDLHNF